MVVTSARFLFAAVTHSTIEFGTGDVSYEHVSYLEHRRYLLTSSAQTSLIEL